MSTPRACNGYPTGTPRACSGHHPSTAAIPRQGGLDPATSCPLPRWQGAGGQRDPLQPLFCRWMDFYPRTRDIPGSVSHGRCPWHLAETPAGLRALSTRGQKRHGAAGAAELAGASRRCSAIRRRSRQGWRGHGTGHVPVPPVTRPQGGQNCPEPCQCVLPPAGAGGTIPGRGHDPGAPLTLAHIWPRCTSGSGTHLASTQPHPHPAPHRRCCQPPGGQGCPRPAAQMGPRAVVRRQTRPYLVPQHRAGRREPGGPAPAPPWLPARWQVGW